MDRQSKIIQRAVMAFENAVSSKTPRQPGSPLEKDEAVLAASLANPHAETWRRFLLDYISAGSVMAHQFGDCAAILTLSPVLEVDVANDEDYIFHSIRKYLPRCGLHFNTQGLFHVSSHNKINTYDRANRRAYPITDLARRPSRSFPIMMRFLGRYWHRRLDNVPSAEAFTDFLNTDAAMRSLSPTVR